MQNIHIVYMNTYFGLVMSQNLGPFVLHCHNDNLMRLIKSCCYKFTQINFQRLAIISIFKTRVRRVVHLKSAKRILVSELVYFWHFSLQEITFKHNDFFD